MLFCKIFKNPDSFFNLLSKAKETPFLYLAANSSI